MVVLIKPKVDQLVQSRASLQNLSLVHMRVGNRFASPLAYNMAALKSNIHPTWIQGS